MARCSSHRAGGGGGGLHHGAAELLLFHPVCRELEGPEEEDGPLPDVVEKEKRLHAPDKVCAGQRKHLSGGMFAENDLVFIAQLFFFKNKGVHNENQMIYYIFVQSPFTGLLSCKMWLYIAS